MRVPEAVPVERVVVGELHLIRARLDETLLALARVAVSAESIDGWGRVEQATRLARRALVAAVTAAPPLPPIRGEGTLLEVGELRVDRGAGRQWWGEREFELSPLHHRLLAVMAADPYRLFGKDELAEAVWRDVAAACPNAVKTSVSRLRRALVSAGAPAGSVMLSRRGIGWTLTRPCSVSDRAQ